jgi:hypothetical protein
VPVSGVWPRADAIAVINNIDIASNITCLVMVFPSGYKAKLKKNAANIVPHLTKNTKE